MTETTTIKVVPISETKLMHQKLQTQRRDIRLSKRHESGAHIGRDNRVPTCPDCAKGLQA